ncbi:MAG TPA: 3,4-dioxygenase subunit beta [Actinoplanes sp.]|nr:3,4-dioxygenase subunit beta [Actinoplanes sp.]
MVPIGVFMYRQPGSFYQGRRLPRPDEEVTDQGLGFDLGTLLARRRVLQAFGTGAAVLGVAACTGSPTTGSGTAASGTTGSGAASSTAASAAASPPALTEIPDETQGPFPGDGSNGPDILERSGVIRSDVRANLDGTSTADGVRLEIELTVISLTGNGQPLVGAAVYIWQCDKAGRYSMYSAGVTRDTFLRGVQITDRAGRVGFTSVFPGCYPGRWPHVHFEVYPDRAAIADHSTVVKTSQLAFPEDVGKLVYREAGYRQSTENLAGVTLDTDMVFRDDHAVTQTATMTGSVSAGYRATLAVGV